MSKPVIARRRGPPGTPAVGWTALLATAVLVAAALAFGALARPASVVVDSAAPTTVPPRPLLPAPASVPTPAASAAAYPTALRIPSIGVATGLVRLEVDASGALAAPGTPDTAGWFAAGPVPGELGPAVLAGHVDSKQGPAVFFRLRTLRPGAEVQVDRSDGRTVAFRVVSVRTFPKDAFPTDDVYGPTPLPELRLVTCGGPFDRAGGRYLDNVIVHAVPL